MESKYKFDVALSFAGEQRGYVEQVATFLKSNGVEVFYDFFHQSELWGQDLTSALEEVYSYQSKYCIIFISKEYAAKEWTCYESAAAMQQLLKSRVKKQEYILPVKFDDTRIPGIFDNIGYLDGNRFTPVDIGKMLLQKIGLSAPPPQYRPAEVLNIICDKITSGCPYHISSSISRSNDLVEIRFTCGGNTRLYIRLEPIHTSHIEKVLVYSFIGEPVYLLEAPSASILMNISPDSGLVLSIDYKNFGFECPVIKQNASLEDVANSLDASVKRCLEGIS